MVWCKFSNFHQSLDQMKWCVHGSHNENSIHTHTYAKYSYILAIHCIMKYFITRCYTMILTYFHEFDFIQRFLHGRDFVCLFDVKRFLRNIQRSRRLIFNIIQCTKRRPMVFSIYKLYDIQLLGCITFKCFELLINLFCWIFFNTIPINSCLYFKTARFLQLCITEIFVVILNLEKKARNRWNLANIVSNPPSSVHKLSGSFWSCLQQINNVNNV